MRICTDSTLVSTSEGLSLAAEGYTRLVAEANTAGIGVPFAKESADVVLVDTSILWTNTSSAPQRVHTAVSLAPTSIISAVFGTVEIAEGLSWAIGGSPNAAIPSANRGGAGYRVATGPGNGGTDPEGAHGVVTLWLDRSAFEDRAGVVLPGDSVHLRYRRTILAIDWTPKTDSVYEVVAGSASVQLWASPVTGVV